MYYKVSGTTVTFTNMSGQSGFTQWTGTTSGGTQPWKDCTTVQKTVMESQVQLQNCAYLFANCKNITSLDMSKFSIQGGADCTSMFAYATLSLPQNQIDALLTHPFAEEVGTNGKLNTLFNNCKIINTSDLTGDFIPYVDASIWFGTSYPTNAVLNLDFWHWDNAEGSFASQYLYIYLASMTFGASSTAGDRYKTKNKIHVDSIKSWDVSATTSMSATFKGVSLYSDDGVWDLSQWAQYSNQWTTCSNMFNTALSSNSNITTLDLTGWNPIKASNLAGMFQGCGSLTSIIAPDWYPNAKVTSSSNMFMYDSRLPNYNYKQVDFTMAKDASKGGYFNNPVATGQWYRKVSGTWQEGTLYKKISGEWKVQEG